MKPRPYRGHRTDKRCPLASYGMPCCASLDRADCPLCNLVDWWHPVTIASVRLPGVVHQSEHVRAEVEAQLDRCSAVSPEQRARILGDA